MKSEFIRKKRLGVIKYYRRSFFLVCNNLLLIKRKDRQAIVKINNIDL